MIKKLHRQLTALFTAATGLILTLVVIGGLVVSARELEKKSLEAFQNDVLGITSRLQSGATISCTWLSQLESSRRLIIHIEDNGVPLLYSGSWSPLTDRNLLIERTREMALAQHIDPSVRPVSPSLLRSPVYTVEGSRKDSYLGCVLVLPVGNSFQSLTLLAYKGPASSGLYRQGFLFLLLNLAGIGALMSVSWILVGKALKPLKENQQKQNEFIAAASHELRAPLAVIRSSISAARSMPRDCEQFMDNMDKECCRMSYLVGDMLLLASADAGHWVIRMAPLDMDTLLIRYVRTVRTPLSGQGRGTAFRTSPILPAQDKRGWEAPGADPVHPFGQCPAIYPKKRFRPAVCLRGAGEPPAVRNQKKPVSDRVRPRLRN